MDKKYDAEFTGQTIPVTEQTGRAIRAGICFHMKLLFSLHMENPELNDLLRGCGFSETPVLANGKTYMISQTVPFLPDEETIMQYENAIEETYANVRKAHFIGFRKLEMREAVYTESEKEDEDAPS